MENKYHFSLMADAIQYIKEHYREQPSLEEVAQHVHSSKTIEAIFDNMAIAYLHIHHAGPGGYNCGVERL